MKKGLKEIIIIFLTTSLAVGSIVYLTAKEVRSAVTQFDLGGYILDTSDESAGAPVNQQYYFSEGAAYSSRSSSENVSFTTVNGEKVAVSSDCFVHYADNSMSSFAKTVILDVDNLNLSNISYYAVSGQTRLAKQGDAYLLNNGGDTISLRNFVWKISESQYMIVSDEITLHVSEDSYQRFSGYIQVQYKDSGIAYIVNQEGTYSTVSSDAYLELDNGIRIYLGSKNVSDKDGILLTLAQMVVNSEDNIEVIPDEDFKIEKDTQPHVVIEANDGTNGEKGEEGDMGSSGIIGAAGAAGEAGESGENGSDGDSGADGALGSDGEQGKTGATGQAGSPGVTGTTGSAGRRGSNGSSGTDGDDGIIGTSASTADVTYAETGEPDFYASVNPSTYGVNVTVTCDWHASTFTDDDADESYVAIFNSATGREEWRYVPTHTEWGVGGIVCSFDCNTLTADTNYTLCVFSSYTNGSNEHYTRENVLTRYFTTDSIGLKLENSYVTSDSITLDFVKVAETGVKTVYVIVTDTTNKTYDPITGDEVPNIVGYMLMDDANRQKYNVSEGLTLSNPSTFDLLESEDVAYVGVGESVPLSLTGLKNNTSYSVQIRITDFIGSVDPSVIVKSENACPVQYFKTLKVSPSVGIPEVSVSNLRKSFIVTPKDVVDPDNGIVSYRYEIYNASAVSRQSGSNIRFTEDPVYSASSDSAKALSVKVDEQTLISGNYYVARVVAQFNNNENTLEYSSPVSAVFSYDPTLSWPTASNTRSAITASTIEGYFVVFDETGETIRRETSDTIDIYISPMKAAVKGDGSTWSSTDNVNEMVLIGSAPATGFNADQKLMINYEAVGLQADTSYVLSVYASTMQMSGSIEHDVFVGSEIVTTSAYYTPISMVGVSATPGANGYFKEYLSFMPNAAYTSGMNGRSSFYGSLSHGGNVSGKSIGYVEFSLYRTYSETNSVLIGKTKKFFDTGNGFFDYSLRRSNAYDADYQMYLKDGGITSAIDVYGESFPAANEKRGFELTAESFEPAGDTEAYYAMFTGSTAMDFTISAKVYDYTSSDGSRAYALWDAPNPIPSRIKADSTLEYEFKYTFRLKESFPDFDAIAKNSSKQQHTRYSKTSLGNMSDENTPSIWYQMKHGVLKSNYPADDISLQETYMKLDGSTYVGIDFKGPSSSVAYAAGWVRYSVYKADSVVGFEKPGDGDQSESGYCTALDKGASIANSGWLYVSDSAQLPSWSFLLDGTAVSRGDNFYVATEFALKDGFCQDIEDPLNPGEFIQKANVVDAGDNTVLITPSTVFPDDFWDNINQHALPKNVKEISCGDTVKGYFCTRFCLDKQMPLVKIAQKTGSASAPASYYATISDPDLAFDADADYTDKLSSDYGNVKKIHLYIGTALTPASDAIADNTSAPAALQNIDTVFPYVIDGITDDWYFKYKLNENEADFTNLVMEKNRDSIDSATPAMIISGANTQLSALVDELSNNTQYSMLLDDQILDGVVVDKVVGRQIFLHYYFVAEDRSDFLRSDLYFFWPAIAANPSINYNGQVPGSASIVLGINDYITASGTSGISNYPTPVVVGEDTYNVFKAETVLDIYDYTALTALGNKKDISLSVSLSSENGSYGLDTIDYGSKYTLQSRSNADARYYYSSIGLTAAPSRNFGLYAVISSGSGNSTHPLIAQTNGLDLRFDANVLTGGNEDLRYVSLTFGSDGLDYIPRQVVYSSAASACFDGPSGPLISMNVDVTPGYNFAAMKFTVEDSSTNVDTSSPITIFYSAYPAEMLDGAGKTLSYAELEARAADTAHYHIVKVITSKKINEFTPTATGSQLRTHTHYLKDLLSDTNYVFKLFLDTDTADPQTFEYCDITYDNAYPDAEKFKTITRIAGAVYGNPVFSAEPAARNKKTVRIQLMFTDVLREDLNTSMNGAYLVLRDSSGTIVSGTMSKNLKTDILAAYDTAAGDGPKKTFTLDVTDLDWAPGTSHLMTSTTSYYSDLMIEYAGSPVHWDVASRTKQLLYSANPNYTGYDSLQQNVYSIGTWNSGSSFLSPQSRRNKTYITVIPEAYYDESYSQSVISFGLAGLDYNRIFMNTGSGNELYLSAELWSGDTRISASPDAGPLTGGKIRCTINTSTGTISPVSAGTYLFTQDLTPNGTYYIKICASWDPDNDNIGSEFAQNSTTVQLPDNVVTVSSLTFNAENTYPVTASGTNIEQIDEIRYTITVNSTVQPAVVLTGASLSSVWKKNLNMQSTYNLAIPAVTENGSSSSYILQIEFYKDGTYINGFTRYWMYTASGGSFFNNFVGKITAFFKD